MSGVFGIGTQAAEHEMRQCRRRLEGVAAVLIQVVCSEWVPDPVTGCLERACMSAEAQPAL